MEWPIAFFSAPSSPAGDAVGKLCSRCQCTTHTAGGRDFFAKLFFIEFFVSSSRVRG